MQKENQIEIKTESAPDSIYIKITKDGPYILYGKTPVNEQIITPNKNGENWVYKEGKTFDTGNGPCCALCRCGASSDKTAFLLLFPFFLLIK